MSAYKASVHRWDVRNRVTFDASKEHIIVIHPSHGVGDDFKLLGCIIDVRLTMEPEIDWIVSRARPKINALRRTRGTYRIFDLIAQYKTYI